MIDLIQTTTRAMKHTVAGLLLVGGAFTIPATASAATISEIVTATPSASVAVFIENGVATLSGIVPEESTRDSLVMAASELDNVSSVNDQLRVSEQRSRKSTTGIRDFNNAIGFSDFNAK